jgi:hypothetical protein
MEDIGEARAILSKGGRVPAQTDVEILALGLAAARFAATGRISDDDLRAAHDLLCQSSVQHTKVGLLESLAEVLLGRGIIPDEDEYDGQWWLWWPKKGHGVCQRCGQRRSLTRYSNMFGRPYRYLCARCRKEERTDDSAELDRVTGTTEQPGESPSSLFMRRLTALAQQRHQDLPGHTEARSAPSGPSEGEWGEYVDRLVHLLGPLDWAGWQVPDSYDSEFDATAGPCLYGTLHRTWMVLAVEYLPDRGELRLDPCEMYDEDEPAVSMLDIATSIDLVGDADQDVQAVAAAAGELGLLDATRLRDAGDGAENEDLTQLMNAAYVRWLLTPAATYRNLDITVLAEELDADPFFRGIFRFVVRLAGYGVLPDLVPDAAVLGVAAWCWRNNTAVEDWHLSGDVLMARVNIAVTKAIQPHVDPYEGIDWDSVHTALTDPSWRLPSGAVIAELFSEGWPEVRRTVGKQVRAWQRLDEEVLGPEATLRLLTIAGSTSYTRHWWGQGRWTAICQRIIDDAVGAGLALPKPYDVADPGTLIGDLSDPDQVSDDVLEWLIDLPEGGLDGPWGLRGHTDATAPVRRTFPAP